MKRTSLTQVDGKHAFELPLPEVGEVQGQKDEAIMEFHIDDTAISDREDALCAVTFLIPDGHPSFPGMLCSATSDFVFTIIFETQNQAKY